VLAYNLTRVMNIIGIKPLLAAIHPLATLSDAGTDAIHISSLNFSHLDSMSNRSRCRLSRKCLKSSASSGRAASHSLRD
jgi:hypothetical protein